MSETMAQCCPRCDPRCHPRCKIFTLLVGMVVSTLITIICIGVYLKVDELCYNRMVENIVLKPGSPAMEVLFDENRYNYLRVWLFNLTNPLAVQKAAKPKLQTVGPYVYRKYSSYANKIWSADGKYTTITYTEKNVYILDTALSVGDPEKDMVIVPKIPDFTVVALGRDFMRFSKVRKIMKHFVKPFFKTTVQKYIWGYDDKLLKFVTRFSGNLLKPNPIGLLLAKNNSFADPITISTGVGDISQLGHVLFINNQSTTDLWAGHYANMLNGTTIALTPPNLQLGASRFMYATSVCRSFNFTIRKKVAAVNFPELELYELGPSAETFHSARDYPPNADFHVNETLGPKPPPAGVFDISNCIFKKKRRVPLFLSLPYFNKAAVEVRDKINFIGEPKQDLEFTLNVEPKSGIILEVYKHFQLNLFAWGHRANRGGFPQLPENIFYPAARFLEDNVASQEALKTLHFKLYKSLTILRILLLTCTGFALVFLLGLLVYSLILLAKMDFSVSTAVSRVKTYMRKQEDTPVKSPMEVIL